VALFIFLHLLTQSYFCDPAPLCWMHKITIWILSLEGQGHDETKMGHKSTFMAILSPWDTKWRQFEVNWMCCGWICNFRQNEVKSSKVKVMAKPDTVKKAEEAYTSTHVIIRCTLAWL